MIIVYVIIHIDWLGLSHSQSWVFLFALWSCGRRTQTVGSCLRGLRRKTQRKFIFPSVVCLSTASLLICIKSNSGQLSPVSNLFEISALVTPCCNEQLPAALCQIVAAGVNTRLEYIGSHVPLVHRMSLMNLLSHQIRSNKCRSLEDSVRRFEYAEMFVL